MAHLTTLDELTQQITVLASVEETDAFFISVYLNLEDENTDWRATINNRARLLRLILKGDELADFNEALDKVETWLDAELLPQAKSVAIFVRGTSGGAFMLPMQFAAPLPNWIVVNPIPNIYHLIELKDNYHRYIVLLAMPDRASIIEINLGAASVQAWINYPDIRTRVRQEWGRPHFQVHQKHRGGRYMHEKIKVLDELVSAGGYSHLILAGDPEITKTILNALPENLLDKMVDVISASEYDLHDDIVMQTLSSFIEHEEQESRSAVEDLVEGLRSQNLAVAGSSDTLTVLRWGEVDTLVMASDYEPEPGWTCTACRSIGFELPATTICPHCSASAVRPMDIREEILRIAGQLQCTVEVVEHSGTLMSLGGVGCLLRTHFDGYIDEQDSSMAASV
jgi:hypothetical protein